MIDIPTKSDASKVLSLDVEWLCVLKKTDHLLSIDSYNQAPISQLENLNISEDDMKEIREDFQDSFEIPSNFKATAPVYQSDMSDLKDVYLNEQTTLFCEMLNLRYLFHLMMINLS